MKVVIFAGGMGTRISEESYLKPKPMIEIGEKPILWHLMKIFEAQGFNDFVICLGYKSFMIKEYFLNYYVYNSDVTVNLLTNSFEVHGPHGKIPCHLVDRIEHPNGRPFKTSPALHRNEEFLSHMAMDGGYQPQKLIDFHHGHGKIATVTAVQPVGRLAFWA